MHTFGQAFRKRLLKFSPAAYFIQEVMKVFDFLTGGPNYNAAEALWNNLLKAGMIEISKADKLKKRFFEGFDSDYRAIREKLEWYEKNIKLNALHRALVIKQMPNEFASYVLSSLKKAQSSIYFQLDDERKQTYDEEAVYMFLGKFFAQLLATTHYEIGRAHV